MVVSFFICTFAPKKDRMSDLMTYVTKHRGWMISVSWVMLLSLFTYTDVFCSMFKVESSFFLDYKSSQMHGISFMVNVGLLIMLVFDFIGAGKHFSNVKVVFILVAVLLAFLIFTFAKLHHTGEIINYIEMIRCTSLVYVFHTLYILILVWLKHESIADECQVVTKIVRKEFD